MLSSSELKSYILILDWDQDLALVGLLGLVNYLGHILDDVGCVDGWHGVALALSNLVNLLVVV